MSHLTDGQLHAYLDGSVEALDGATLVEAHSHIAACDDCSARLEAARLVRDEAVSLLGTAAPSSFSPPAFEELERRAALVDPVDDSAAGPPRGRSLPSGRNAASGRLFRRSGSLAWAASLTVALTAGWLARGTVGTGLTERPAVTAPSETVALQDKQEASALDQSVGREAAESLEGSVTGEGGYDEATRRSLARQATERSAESASEPKEDRNAQAAAPPEFFAREGAETEADADRRRGDRLAMDEVATETAGDEAAPADDRPAPVAEEVEARRLEAGNREQVAQPEPQRAKEPVLERAAAKMAQPDVAGRPPGGLGAVDGPADWQPVHREQAEALLGGALKTVEGLRVLSVYARAAGAAPEVWTAQQLDSGHQLNLRQTPIGDGRFGDLEESGAENERAEQAAEPADPAAEPVSEMEARTPLQQAYYETLESLLVDGFLIEATAPLSRDSLRSLLSRLRD